MMGKISIQIDDRKVSAEKGSTILETALANKIYIPHLCYHPELKPAGSCRLCLVEFKDGKLVASCRTPVQEGMVLYTKSDNLDKVRRPVVEMIIANHHMDCRNCLKKGKCQLQRVMAFMKTDKKKIQETMRLPKEELPVDGSNPFFYRDHNKCVLCGICVRTCREIQRVNAVDFAGRGDKSKITTFGDKPIAQSACVSCGECVIRCPVGALIAPKMGRPAFEVQSICPHCGVGCGMLIGVRDNAIVHVRGDRDNPSNHGLLCARGRFGLHFVHAPERLKTPLIRKKGKLIKASWSQALEMIARKLKRIRRDEFALIASSKCTNEESYIAQKFTRVVMQSNNIDNSERFNHSASIAALLGRNAAETFSLTDTSDKIEKADCILIIGANITDSHPVLGLRIKNAVAHGAKLIVIDPKEIDICRFADVWVRPYPGTDLAVLMGICNVILDEEMHDKAFIKKHCKGFEAFQESLEDFSLGRVERLTGVSRDIIKEVAKTLVSGKLSLSLWAGGITQYAHGANNVLGLLNLSLLTGNMKNTQNLMPLWGNNNACGACYMGCLPDYYCAYQKVSDKDTQKRFEKAWAAKLNPEPGLTLTEMLEASLQGQIKALYIIGSDLASGLPVQKVKDALKKTEFSVLQDILCNDISEFADVILPAASFAEKDGHFTNSECRVQKISKVLDPTETVRPDWGILCDLAGKMGAEGFHYRSAEEVMSEITSLDPGIRKKQGKYSFVPLEYKALDENSDMDYPLIAITQRDIFARSVLVQNTEGFDMLRTGNAVSINPKDAADFAIGDGETVRVTSRWGELRARAQVTERIPPGLTITNMPEDRVSPIFNPTPAIDPLTHVPEKKIAAVRIEREKDTSDE